MSLRNVWALIVLGCFGMGYLCAGDYSWTTGTVSGGTYLADPLVSGDVPNKITINGDITIDGDVVIENTRGSCSYFPVEITGDSFLHPAYDSSQGYGHLILYAGQDSGIFFQVDSDLIFTGSNVGDKDANNRDLVITFSGPGQTVFHIGSGKQVGFEGFFGTGLTGLPAWNNYWDDYTKTGSGVKAYVVMDQTYECAVENGANKVIFERYYSYDGTLPDPTLSSTTESVKISIGKNSFITYISDVDTGLLDCDGSGCGYGSLAFDPMCYGAGRMLLHIKGSNYVASDGTFTGLSHAYNDGALVVSGHYVSDYSTTTGILTGVKLNQPAGVEALFRIIDEQAFRDSDYYKDDAYSSFNALYLNSYREPVLNGGDLSGNPSRRGLLVLNENKSIPVFAADTYVNNAWKNEYTYKTLGLGSSSIRPGFILGINGTMELFHNTFLDYVAASTMMLSPYDLDQFGAEISTTVRKNHNPSALVVDGLGILDINTFDPNDPYNTSNLLYPYSADAASNGGRHAQILLRGDSRLYLRSGVRSDGYVSTDSSLEGSGGLGGYLAGQSGLERIYSFTINYDSSEGTYDGSFIAGLASDGGLWYETDGEGNNVLDIEGKVTIRSTSDANQTNESGFVIHKLNREVYPDSSTCCFARHITTSYDVFPVSARGMINVPPIKLDYMGQEIKNDYLIRIERPLTVNDAYPCYNSSSIFLNAEMALHNIQWHHNDVLKIATPEQDKSEPAVVGGEKAVYDYAYWSTVGTGTANTLYVDNPIEDINTKNPLISLYNSTLHVHESIVASGVRFVVTDKFWYDTQDSLGHAKLVPNTSVFKCYNHGDPLDMLKRGYGRTINLGTQQNKMADDILLNDYTQNAYVNVYRTWNTDGNAGIWGDGDYLVRLSLETDIQPKYIAQYEPRTFSKLEDSSVDQYKRVATQVFYLGNNSYSSLGWTTTNGDQVISVADMRDRVYGVDGSYSYTFGINEGSRPRPWDAAWGLGSPTNLDLSSATYDDFKFSLTSEANDPAEMYINGDNFYFGGRDSSGNLATEPVVASNESCVFYTNHGGKTHINQGTLSLDQQHYYDCYVDTIFAYRPWPRILNGAGDRYIDGLSGIIELPHDQAKFGRSIQPYNLNFQTMLLANDGQTKERNVRLSVYDEKLYGTRPVNRAKASGEEVTIPWNFRTDKSVSIAGLESSPTYTPIKALALNSQDQQDIFPFVFKTTKTAEELISELNMPEAVLTVSTGDVINQMRISGATKADPFHLYVTGGDQGYGLVREFTSLASNYFNPGEGCHAAIILDGGGHIGLGTRDWNEHSNNAWSILGSDYVSLHPNGNGFVYVNSDIIVADRLAIIPTSNFGSYGNSDQMLTYDTEDQRLTFYSELPVEIRIPEGGELDLSAFGHIPAGKNVVDTFAPQQIEVGGKIRLVFEAGSRLRFPDGDLTNRVVLYMNDEAEIIFEGVDDRDEGRWTDYTYGDAQRIKILGEGQIWLNKNARMRINGTALVGIETDDSTVESDITISISRKGKFFIGDDNVSGGAFQVGNPTDVSGSSIKFNLTLRGAESEIRIAREGFVGLGAGVVNKSGAPNGDWRINGLYNVDEIDINVNEGTFNHSQIYDGDNSRASMLAVGPATTYKMELGDFTTAIVQGGGNLLRIAAAGDVYPNTGGIDGNGTPPHSTTHAGSTAALTGDTTGDYTIMASGPIIRQITAVSNGTGTITQGESFEGDAQGFYNFIEFQPFGSILSPYSCLGKSQNEQRIGYIVGTTITRTSVFSIADGSNPEDSIRIGALKASIDASNELVALTRGY